MAPKGANGTQGDKRHPRGKMAPEAKPRLPLAPEAVQNPRISSQHAINALYTIVTCYIWTTQYAIPVYYH